MLAAILVPLNSNAGLQYSGSDANAAPADAAAMALTALYAETNQAPTDGVTFLVSTLLAEINQTPTDAAQYALTALLADGNATPTDGSALGAGMGYSDAIAAQADVMVQMRQTQAQSQTQTQQSGTTTLDTFLPQRVNYQPSYSPDEIKRLRRLERKLARLRGQVARAAARSDVPAVHALKARISAVIEEIGDEDEELLVIGAQLTDEVATVLHIALIAARVIH